MLIALVCVSIVGIAAIAYAVWKTIQCRADERDALAAGELARIIAESFSDVPFSVKTPMAPASTQARLTTSEKTMKKRIMIDLETLSVTKSAAIIQLGAVVFRPCPLEYTGPLEDFVFERFGVNVTLQSCIDAGLVTDDATIAWWQRPEQLEAFRTTQSLSVDLRDALIMFRTWCLADTDVEDIEPWANGTSFDLAILETAYRKIGIPMPWKFFNERDYRTMKSLWRDVKKPDFTGTKHNATDDAANQAVHLIAILQGIESAERFVAHMTEGREVTPLETRADA